MFSADKISDQVQLSSDIKAAGSILVEKIGILDSWTLGAGLWTLDSGRWTLDSGRWTLDVSLITQTTI